MVSIRDVARAAGVSTATVVRVLNGGTAVSEARAQRVRDVVAELDYVPNAVASSLSRGKTGLLGLLVSDIANPFSAQVARGLEDESAHHGYHVLVGSSDFDPDREANLLVSFARRTVDAVALLSSSGQSQGIRRLVRNRIPVVLVDRRPPATDDIPLVRTDSLGAAQQAVRYLIDLGHRDLAMISGPAEMPTAAQRLAGFRTACAEAGLVVRAECIRQGFLGSDGGHAAMCEVLDLEPRPTAVFSFNNMLAIGALRAVRERGVRIPDDLSLVTFDDTELFPFVDPPITAIAQPAYQIGQEAARVLFKLLAGEHPPSASDAVLPTEFRIRRSCGPPRPAKQSPGGASARE